MPRIGVSLSGIVAMLLFGPGCSERAKPPAASAFSRNSDFPLELETVAKPAGVYLAGFSGVGDRNRGDGKSNWKGQAQVCARPDQIDELMRAYHAGIAKRVQDSGAEASGEPLPPGATPVKEWRIAYSDGPQEGTIRATRNDGAAGQCQVASLLLYQIDLLFEEMPNPAR